MADAHDDTDKENKTVGKGPAIAFSLILILVGLGLAAFPLIWWELQAEPNTAISAATYPVFHWIGLCFLVAGLSVMIGKLIVFDAMGAGKAKFAGFELPVQIGGTAFLFMFLMLGFSFISERYDLANVQERSQELVDQQAEVEKNRSQLAQLQQVLADTQSSLAAVQAQSNAYNHILTSQMDDDDGGIELLRLRVDCGDMGTHWIDWALPDADNNDIVESLSPWESPRQRHEVHGLRLDRGGTMRFVIRTTRRIPIMTTRLSFEGDVVVATIRPRSASLSDYCDTLDQQHLSDTVLTSRAADVRSTALEVSNE